MGKGWVGGWVINWTGGDRELDKTLSVASDNNEEVWTMIILLRLEAIMVIVSTDQKLIGDAGRYYNHKFNEQELL